MFAKAQRVHFIGIGGIGMSGIAEVLINLGYPVSGSDLRTSPVTDRLSSLGAAFFEGHSAANVVGADVVVASSAVNPANPEVVEARNRKIPVIQRAEMLAELMRLKYGIAIAGMHGKTTTTTMVGTVLAEAGLDPTIIVGGRVEALGSNARMGSSRYLVAEADESDRSFLKLSPILAVVTNLDREHMDAYRDMDDVEQAFLEFMDRIPFYGATIACLDNPLLAAILPRVTRRVITYGTRAEADYVLRMLPRSADGYATFEVVHEGRILGPFHLHVPGRHNVLNATAAIAIASQLEVEPELIIRGIAAYRGVDRRFQRRGNVHGIDVIDDYGHHPTEIRATLATAAECGYAAIHVIFQPHRYSRTRDLLSEFATCFAGATSLEILPIYAASEAPIPGIDSEHLAELVNAQPATGADGGTPQLQAHYAATPEQAIAGVLERARPGDVILTLGAGSVSQLGPRILTALEAAATPPVVMTGKTSQ